MKGRGVRGVRGVRGARGVKAHTHNQSQTHKHKHIIQRRPYDQQHCRLYMALRLVPVAGLNQFRQQTALVIIRLGSYMTDWSTPTASTIT